MRRLVFVILVSSLLLTLAFVYEGNIPAVKASSSIYQGDLILTGNNVTTIEGRFDINGSIIVENNATLILKNAFLNLTQSQPNQYNITLRNPSNGNPRLSASNSTITSSTYFRTYLHENSTTTIDNSTISHYLFPMGHSVLSVSNDSYVYFLGVYDYSITRVLDSFIKSLWTSEPSETQVYSSEIDSFVHISRSVNCTISELEPGLVNYWSFTNNHSVIILPGGLISNVTLINARVNNWGFVFEGYSNAMISSSTIGYIYAYDFSSVSLESTICYYVHAGGSSVLFITDSPMTELRVYGSSKGWLLNSTYIKLYTVSSARVFISWYLDVHVIDSIGQDVPSANVTTTYPNATVAESKLTDTNGWARLTLMEKMINDTDSYPVGNYTVTAKYEIHEGQQSVNMTDNQEITIQLPFIIPEFPSYLVLPLFMIATLLAVMVYRRQLKKGNVGV